MYQRLVFGALFATALGLTACDSKGGLVTPNNPLNPTAVPATPTPAPTATPTAAPSRAPTACVAPPPDPNTGTIVLTGAVQTVTVPCFSTFMATATVPANSSAGATIALMTSTDRNFGAVVTPGNGTPLLYTSLQPSTALAFTSSTATIATVVTSATIAAPHTYTIESYVPALGQPLQTIPNLTPAGHSISYALATQGGSFPPIQVIVILYQSS